MINKISLLSIAGLAMASVANAGIYVGHQMDASSVASSGWVCTRAGHEFSVAEGNTINLTVGNNSGAVYNKWGADAWAKSDAKNSDVDNYYFSTTVAFKMGNDVNKNADGTYKQQGSGFFLTSTTEDGVWSQNWWTGGDNWLFALNEVTNSEVNPDPLNNPVFAINGDQDNLITFTSNEFYTFNVTINKDTREVAFEILHEGDEAAMATGSRVAPEGIDILPTGFYMGLNRYYPSAKFKSLVVGKKVAGDIPNKPSIKLIQVVGKSRVLEFVPSSEKEIIHVEARNGAKLSDMDENEIESIEFTYDKVSNRENMIYVDESGDVAAWTTIGDLKSDENMMSVECSTIKLPTPKAEITLVEPGYTKTYRITIDNSEVLTKPDITFSYVYGNGSTIISKGDDIASGSQILLEGAGVLKVKAVLVGFEDSEFNTIVNNEYYEISKSIDFQNMTADELKAKSFEQNGSVRDYWTSFGRGFVAVTPDGDNVAKTFVPKYENPSEAMVPYQLKSSLLQTEEMASNVFENLTLWYGDLTANAYVLTNVGLITALNRGDDEAGTAQNTYQLSLNGFTDEDFMIVYKMYGYSRNCFDPKATAYEAHYEIEGATIDECKAKFEEQNLERQYQGSQILKATDKIDLNRYDTAITAIDILTKNAEKTVEVSAPTENAENAIEEVHVVVDGNAVFYTTGGVKVANPVRGQLYIIVNYGVSELRRY